MFRQPKIFTANLLGFAVFCWMGAMQTAQGQPPDTMWTRVYPGIGEPWSFEQTSDGGFIVASKDYFADDATLTKIDSSGNLEWNRVYVVDNRSTIHDVVQGSLGGYIGVGRIFGSPHHFDFATYCLFVDNEGDTIWTRELNIDTTNDDVFEAVVALTDGVICVGQAGYIGSSNNAGDILIVRMTLLGDTLWSRRYGTAFPDRAYDIIKLSDDRYLIAGTAGDPDALEQYHTEAFALLINGAGDSLWMHTYSNDPYILCEHAEFDGESGFLLTGVARSEQWGVGDVYVMHGDSMGNLIWQNHYGGEYTQIGRDLRKDESGGYVVFGGQGPTDAIGVRFYTLRLNDSGDSLWSATYSGSIGISMYYFGLGGFILPDGGYMMMGLQYPLDGGQLGTLLIRTYPEGLGASDPPVFVPDRIALLSAYPNPFNPTTTIQYTLSASSTVELMLYDLLGRQVQLLLQERQFPGEHCLQFEGVGLASGIYFVRLKTQVEDQTIKLFLEK